MLILAAYPRMENLNAETFLAYTLNTFETGSKEIEALVHTRWVRAV